MDLLRMLWQCGCVWLRRVSQYRSGHDRPFAHALTTDETTRDGRVSAQSDEYGSVRECIRVKVRGAMGIMA